MEHPRMATPDITDGNIDKIGALFPNCITETKDKKGTLRRTIDFDLLRQELSKDIVEGPQERYQFTWPDKRRAIRTANTPIDKTLRPCREESVDFDTTKNLYIEGDNLEALKLLRENYLGRVKMIYIDPPYNTGNDFVYRDDFSQTNISYKSRSGLYDENGLLLESDNYEKNSATAGRFHTNWLNMIYPRILVSRCLLREDGLIFISIDDKEVSNLIAICNSIFGEHNFVGNIIWQSRTSISNDDEISTNHNHTLVYSKNRESLIFYGENIDSSEYINPDNDPRGPWKLVPIDANHVGGDTLYPIINPLNGDEYYPPHGRIWCYNQATMLSLMKDGRIKFGLNDNSAPKRKLFLNERNEKGDCKTPSSILLNAGTTKTGTVEIMSLFEGNKIFDYPKPSTLIQRLIQYSAVQCGDIILDFFSGSATCAQSIFQYSISKNINCQYILVQYPENLDKVFLKADTDAKKTIKTAILYLDKIGKRHTICEIGKERIRRAGRKIREEKQGEIDKLRSEVEALDRQIKASGEGSLFGTGDVVKARDEKRAEVEQMENRLASLDTGFRVLKVDESNMLDVYYTPEKFDGELFEDNIKPGRSDEDLLFQVMLESNMELSCSIEKKSIQGKTVWFADGNYLVACFEKNLNENVITEIARMKPYYFYMRDWSLSKDSLADNFDQLFEYYSPDTVRKIL